MDRDDAGMSDRSDEARQGDTGMIGSESEEPGPGRDTSLTDPDPAAASTEQPRGTVGMSEGDPMRTRLGSHLEGAGLIGYDVTAAEEGATQATPADDRPAYEPERSATDPSGAADFDRDPGLAAEPVVDQGAYQQEPGQDVPATYTGEEAEVSGRPEYAERTEGGDQPLYQEETQRMDRPGGGGSLFTDEEPERLDRPGPQEPGLQDGLYDQEADQARRPSDGV
jgi:hypothetical protein